MSNNKHIERISNGLEVAAALVFLLVVFALILGILALIAKGIMMFSVIAAKVALVVTALVVLFYVLGVLDERIEEVD